MEHIGMNVQYFARPLASPFLSSVVESFPFGVSIAKISIAVFLLILVVGFAIFVLEVSIWIRYPRPHTPYPLPLIGHLLYDLINRQDHYYDESIDNYYEEESKKPEKDRFINRSRTEKVVVPSTRHLFPLYEFIRPSTLTIVLDPECVEHMLKTNFENYEKGPILREILNPLLGNGIFNSDGFHWKIQRKTASHEFSVRKFRDFQTVVFHENSEQLIKLIRGFLPLKDGSKSVQRDTLASTTFDLQDLFQRYTLNSIGKIGFGIDLQCLTHAPLSFVRAFDMATASTYPRVEWPMVWKLFRLCNFWFEKDLKESIEEIDKFCYKIIEERRELSLDSLEKNSDLLSRFVHLKDENGQDYSDVFLRDVVINFILAGRDTTSNCLSWLFYELMTHPEVVQRIRIEMFENGLLRKSRADPPTNEEKRDVHSDEEQNPGVYAMPTYDELSGLHYLQATITEALRLHPPVPVDLKMAVNDDVLPDNSRIRGGTFVAFVPYMMGRLDVIWGADCLKFKPERHLKDGKYVHPNMFKFPVFQAGPRLCLGMYMAYLEIKMATVCLLREFSFQLVPGQDITYARSITLPMKNGLQVSVLKWKKDPFRSVAEDAGTTRSAMTEDSHSGLRMRAKNQQ